MIKFLISIITATVLVMLFINSRPVTDSQSVTISEIEKAPEDKFYTVTGIVKAKDTMDAIFKRHGLDRMELFMISKTSKKAYDLSRLSVGTIYSFRMDKESNNIQNMQYGIDDRSFLNVTKDEEGYHAEKISIEPDKKIGSFYITIKDNLIISMPGAHREYNKLALDLSEIYAWDIDFSNDIRNGDSLKILVEELWVGEVFKGFGNILAAEFINNGKLYMAYRFEHDGHADYYDDNGKSLKKALMKSPLKFNHISSRFSKRRLHPKLRIYRPHLGVDYAAATGTPVSAAGSGTVKFAGYKGQNGKMVRIKHKGGYETYYGHLSKIPRKIKKGSKVSQGDIIGYVGSTGLATGPHLDYRIKRNSNFVNPLKIRLPRGTSIPKSLMSSFRELTNSFEARLASLTQPIMALNKKKKITG